jgi:hypothetical protein
VAARVAAVASGSDSKRPSFKQLDYLRWRMPSLQPLVGLLFPQLRSLWLEYHSAAQVADSAKHLPALLQSTPYLCAISMPGPERSLSEAALAPLAAVLGSGLRFLSSVRAAGGQVGEFPPFDRENCERVVDHIEIERGAVLLPALRALRPWRLPRLRTLQVEYGLVLEFPVEPESKVCSGLQRLLLRSRARTTVACRVGFSPDAAHAFASGAQTSPGTLRLPGWLQADLDTWEANNAGALLLQACFQGLPGVAAHLIRECSMDPSARTQVGSPCIALCSTASFVRCVG